MGFTDSVEATVLPPGPAFSEQDMPFCGITPVPMYASVPASQSASANV
jgi:hypothetical protein